MMAKAGCPIVDLPASSQFNALAEWFQRCAQWRTRVMDRLRTDRPQLVVVGSARAYDATGIHTMTPGLEMFDAAWLDGLADLTRELRENGTQIMVLGPSVDLPMSAPLCLSAHPDDVSACAGRFDAGYSSGVAAESAAVEEAGGQYADISEHFCSDTYCPVIVGNTLVYFDAGHITREYARLVAPAFGALVSRALALG